VPSFTFFPDIPQPGDDPSQSQGAILQNFAAIGTPATSPPGSWTTQDHYGFGTGTDGQHKQVTFAGNNAPAPPVSPPVLFTQNDAFLLPQLFYYSGDAAHSSNQYVAAINGSTMLLGGIIMKWGQVALAANNQSVSFAGGSFPNNLFSISLNTFNKGNAPGYYSANAVSTAGFQIYQVSGLFPTNVFYIAIGN
jgi:hypothetical protein